MKITEQENGKGAVGKTRHLAISRRDTLVNDLKNSTPEGAFSVLSALVSLGLTVCAVRFSLNSAGNAGPEAGVLCAGAFIMAVFAVLFGIRGKRNRLRIRHFMEKRGILLGVLMLLLLTALFVRGLILCGI